MEKIFLPKIFSFFNVFFTIFFFLFFGGGGFYSSFKDTKVTIKSYYGCYCTEKLLKWHKGPSLAGRAKKRRPKAKPSARARSCAHVVGRTFQCIITIVCQKRSYQLWLKLGQVCKNFRVCALASLLPTSKCFICPSVLNMTVKHNLGQFLNATTTFFIFFTLMLYSIKYVV